ncbi:MAG: indolepyruvate ferredoxin oxidoreductase family protein [Rhodoferax sp.]
MNAPLPSAAQAAPPHPGSAAHGVQLDDKYTLQSGRAFMSGVQALVRLPLVQRLRDQKQGLNTAGFVSGYRGSPLGGYDQALAAAKKHLDAHHVVFQPGVNEELGATAVWGTQQLDLYPQDKRYDGVFGIWYGKGPGVDRSSDVFKHANMAGTARHGGVVAVAGDDHISKSSTAAHQSDHIFKACGLPVFFPSDVQGILDMGLHALAMSRFAGVWTGMKTIQEVVESSASVDVDVDRVRIVLPEDFQMPPGGVHIRWPDHALEQEARLMDTKWYAALAYVRANGLNHNVVATPNDRFGLIASGKAYNDMRQALVDLGLDDDTCRRLGIRVHKVNVVWPLEASITRDFAQGLQEILVVEEKRQVIEYQLKEELYNWRADVRPNVLGKFDEPEGDTSGGEWSRANPSDNWLLRAKADLSPALIAKAIAKRLNKLGVPEDVARRMQERIAVIEAKERAALTLGSAPAQDRLPWFCSGCPHNTSTRVPEGSRALAGIGCHYMTLWMDRSTATFTQMGGEGVTWVGQQPFSKAQHVFANLGDGTYFHSGLLAIRQSIAAGVNITYKILYNDAVAMTGGQRVGERPEGHSVLQIMHSLVSEGVRKLLIVTDEPAKYAGVALAAGVTVHHRDELDALQRQLREIAGTTALIYDQTCATEKRRRRKRGTLAESDTRVLINPLVCEGCGDCGEQSNCLSVEPLETPFGRKRAINQSTCNKDISCAKGFCPSFVSVQGARLKKAATPAQAPTAASAWPALPEPTLPQARSAWGIVVGGVGGTGVITIGQLLGMAAHLEGKGVVTQDAGGLAQKGGATWSHVQIADHRDAIYTTKVDTAKADLVIGCDAIVAAHKNTLAVMQSGRTYVALNSHATPTAAFVHDTQWQFPAAACENAIAAAVGPERLGQFDAEWLAVQALGDSIYANPVLLGYAWQKGCIPLCLDSLLRAIELNGVQPDKNQQAFTWGRRMAHDPQRVQAQFQARTVVQWVKKPTLDEVLTERVRFLTDYQDAAYAQSYASLVQRVREAEAPLARSSLALAVAHNLFKLMACKDEYEVARLHTQGALQKQLDDSFEGDYKVFFHFAPPLWARRDAQGLPVKRRYGAWVLPALRALAALKGLRGTAWDLFGYTQERRWERSLVEQYRAAIGSAIQCLDETRHAQTLAFAQLPQELRGFGHVKARHWEKVRARWDEGCAGLKK